MVSISRPAMKILEHGGAKFIPIAVHLIRQDENFQIIYASKWYQPVNRVTFSNCFVVCKVYHSG